MRASTRRLTLFDTLVMIAATGVGLAGSATIWNGDFYTANSYLVFDFAFLKRFTAWVHYLGHFSYLLSPCAAMWTLAVSALALKHPRPTMRRLTCQPEVIGCWAASMALVASAGLYLGNAAWNHIILVGDVGGDVMEPAFRPMGCAVLATWAIAVVGRRWRPECNWIDRLGRILAVIWVVSLPFPIFYTTPSW